MNVCLLQDWKVMMRLRIEDCGKKFKDGTQYDGYMTLINIGREQVELDEKSITHV